MIQVTNINTKSNGETSSVMLCLGTTEYNPIPLKNVVNGIVDLRIKNHRDMSVVEFADEAGVSRQAVIKMIATGRIQAEKIGERYIIAPEQLAKYLRER